MSLFSDRNGFTLLEIVVIVAILSIVASLSVPNIISILGSERKNSSIIISYITATGDDSIKRSRDIYLCIHLGESEEEKGKENFEHSESINAVDVYSLEGRKFVLSKNRILKHREFPKNFKIENVKIADLPPLMTGNIFIPFYSDGTSEPFELQIRTPDSRIKLIKQRHTRVPILIDDNTIE